MSKKNSNRLQIEYRSPHELRPRPDNAKVHSKQQINKIVKSIKRFGFVNPRLSGLESSSSNLLLPLGGLAITLFVGWVIILPIASGGGAPAT